MSSIFWKVHVLILGGKLGTGVEIWNPYQRSVQLVLDVHPQETALNGLEYARLLPINGN